MNNNKPTIQRNEKGRFLKGAPSPNPEGSRLHKFSSKALRLEIEKDITEVLDVVKESALAGDISACKLLVDRVVPVVKPIGQQAVLDNLTPDGISSAVSEGAIDIDHAAKLMNLIMSMQTYHQNESLEQRLDKIEAALKNHESNI